MTYNTKNTTYVFVLAAMLMAMPFATVTANATTTSGGNIDATCGITAPTSIDLGSITAGSTSSEVAVTLATTGTLTGTIDLKTTDWTGSGAKAIGSITVLTTAVGDTVTINSHIYTGAATAGTNIFDADGTTSATATSLAAIINAKGAQTVAEAYGTNDNEVTAIATNNVVLLYADDVGASPNAITLATSDTSAFTLSGAVLTGGAAAATHMLAESVKVTALKASASAPGTAYTDSAKISLENGGVEQVLETATDPEDDSVFYFHLDGVSTKASNIFTFGTGSLDTETIVLDGTTFAAETTPADVDGNEFLVVGTATTDATAFTNAVNAAGNMKVTATDNSDGTVTITALVAGTVGNSLASTETITGGSFASGTTLASGTDQLTNLPYSGALTSTFTFGTVCNGS